MDDKKRFFQSYLFIHLAVFLFGAAGLFGKLVDLPSAIIVFGRVFFASITIFLFLKVKKNNLKLADKRHYLILFLIGALLAFHWFTFFKSIMLSSVATGLLTYSTFPVFTAFLEPLFFKKRLETIQFVFAVITFSGVYLVIPDIGISHIKISAVIYGLLSGLAFSLISILNRKMTEKIQPVVISFYMNLSAALILLPTIFIGIPSFSVKSVLLLVLLGVIFTALAHTLFISGMKNISVLNASLIASLEPVYGILLASLLINEIPSIKIIIGGMLIVSMVILSTIVKNRH